MKDAYQRDLRQGVLSTRTIDQLVAAVRRHMRVSPVPKALLRRGAHGPPIPGNLRRLPLYVARGNRSWEGLMVGFPGSSKELKAEYLGTPFLRKLLYPILELHRRLESCLGRRPPCVYLLGTRFPDVVLRKFRLLSALIPTPVILTSGHLRGIKKHVAPVGTSSSTSEAAMQRSVLAGMTNVNGLEVPTATGTIRLGYVSYEMPTAEGTTNPERLDVLGHDLDDGSLVAFELKRGAAGREEVQNLFLQAWEHLAWVEENKRAIKLLFEGPRGSRINTRKRARLLLGLDTDTVPDLFWELRRAALRVDPYLEIDFLEIQHDAACATVKLLPEPPRPPAR